MTTPYRTASVPTAPRVPWWRRALCAIGSHLFCLSDFDCARCEHCSHETNELLTMRDYYDALDHTLDRYRAGKSTPDEARFVEDHYRYVRNAHVE